MACSLLRQLPPLPFLCSPLNPLPLLSPHANIHLTQVEERNQAIEGDYGVICDLYPPFRDVATLEEFKWARMCVCSRNFGLDIGGLRTSALVPYADMLNHYR